jgi:hypothetical protein
VGRLEPMMACLHHVVILKVYAETFAWTRRGRQTIKIGRQYESSASAFLLEREQ